MNQPASGSKTGCPRAHTTRGDGRPNPHPCCGLARRRLGAPLATTATGSVYVEFLVAVVPLFLFFWGILQVNGLLLADLIVRDAATNAVRAAIVCDSDEKTSGQSGAMDCAQQAVHDTVKADTSISSTSVTVDGASDSGNGQVTATVTASYTCLVPMVSALVCGGGVATLERSATLPNQGHYYKF